ncbi:sulfatase-like hydrolase/transferase [Phycicoccus flavus]|uniref:sulfatase-like hydrolase/transferase n=1 Tax=Phycicoccus flavus TaxID=2502783 RepID=UPI000FEC15D9|nr:sulfatase-like hydrolase/transferase [Phycicoccus flavus]NHA67162.1 sulfatase-like hydrolase/transferase [Phycicoccus flavus]
MTDEPPLVLWILADELRADALSCYGTPHPAIETPNIDRLAREGVLFESSSCASPVCTPSRAAQLTGLEPHVSGVYGNEASSAGYPETAFTGPGREPVTFPEVLAEHGWSTRSFGKEHLPAGLDPWQHHDPEGGNMKHLLAAADDVDPVRSPELGFVVGGVFPAGRDYPPAGVTDRTVAALRAAEGPTLVRASYLQPHTPVLPPAELADRYADLDIGLPGDDEPSQNAFEARFAAVNGGPEVPHEVRALARRHYFALVAWLDGEVGRLLDALDDAGLAERAVVVLTADHGAYLGEQGAWGKHTFAPQSHRVPLLVRDPGRLPGGTRRTDLAAGHDLARTVLGRCGVAAPASMRGRDLFADPAPEHVVSTIGYGAAASRAFPNRAEGTYTDGSGWPRRTCVRTDRYRLDLTTVLDGRRPEPQDEDVFLADTVLDPHELVDISGRPEYAAVLESLRAIARSCAGDLPGEDTLAGHRSAPDAAPAVGGG